MLLRDEQESREKLIPVATVLVVDDDENLRSILAYRLRREGHTVLLASDGLEALKCAAEAQADVILLDLSLPLLDGFGVLRRLHDSVKTRSIPVLIITAYGDEETRRAGFELGASGFIHKPFSPRQVAADVARALAPQRAAHA